MDSHLQTAIELAVRNVAEGGGPFGAIVVTANGAVYEGVNRVTRDNDPTAHGEVTAIRDACRGEGTFSLHGATLYTSCEPCPLCLSAALWARIERVVYAADRHDAARAGFDDAEFYEAFATPREEWKMAVTRETPADLGAPFDAWNAKSDRTEY
ncbi:nucleoside deaminase [Micrococcales bacterium 31B]|nr:nucleoside deaminase [Micrococcales bacterium 31B]